MDVFFFQAEDGIRDLVRSRGLGDVYKRQMMIRIFEMDFGYGYKPEFHSDVSAMESVYIDNSRHLLLVAIDDASGAIAATAGVRSGGLKPEFNHAWLVARYDPERTAQLVRVYVAREYRRHGLARRPVSYTHLTLPTSDLV